GEAWYLATSPEAAFLRDWLPGLCAEAGVKPLLQEVPSGVETTLRVKDGKRLLFVLNHNADAVDVKLAGHAGTDLLSGTPLSGAVTLAGRGVWIIELK
ncbi:MAG: Beta-galactosidase C-terminal domain, partial [Cohnella sp.]|nr:Beta-galactosidase C-terminal domain [Cohnella sp.]